MLKCIIFLANQLLPSFGYCDIITTAGDIRTSQSDKLRLVCEISQHVLYQYMFMVLWAAMVTGVIVATISLVISLFSLLTKITGLR